MRELVADPADAFEDHGIDTATSQGKNVIVRQNRTGTKLWKNLSGKMKSSKFRSMVPR
jgi:hypothetical protein